MNYLELTPERLYLALNFLALWDNTNPGGRFMVIKPRNNPQNPVIERRQTKVLLTFNPKTTKEEIAKFLARAKELIIVKTEIGAVDK